MDRLISVVSMSAGGGHNATANAIKAGMLSYTDINTSIVDIRTILNDVDPVKKWLGIKIENVYNTMLRNNIYYGMEYYLRFVQKVIDWKYWPIYYTLKSYFKEVNPDVIVSVIPNFNYVLAEVALALHKPFVTVMADMADQPPNFWDAKHPHQVLIAPDNSGCVVHPKFYNLDKQSHYYTAEGLVLFGGYGSKEMIFIAKRLNGVNIPNKKLYMIFLIGHNTELRDKLNSLETSYQKHVIGYTDQVNFFMQGSDFIICKPGPGVLSEAIVTKVPVITSKRAMWQEKPNVEWVQQEKFGVVLDSFKDVKKGVEEVMQNPLYQSNVRRLTNNMIFKVCEYLNKI